jgi:glycosyltransferase 2 family protein
MYKKNLLKFAKIFVSASLVFWLIFSINWREVLEIISGVKIGFLFLFLFFYLTGIFISAYKWQKLAEFRGFSFPFSFFIKTYLFGALLNNFFPSIIGGDTFRSYELGKKNKSYAESSSTVVADRITGLLGITFLAVLFSFANIFMQKQFDSYFYFVLGVLLLFFLTLLFVYNFHKKSLQYLLNFLPQIVKEYSTKIISYRKPSVALPASAWSILFAFVGLAVTNYFLFLSVGISLAWLNYLSVIFFISIASSFPISIGNIGVKEWAYITFFGFFGVTSATAVAVVLLSRAIQLLVSLLVLPFYLKDSKIQKSL